MKNIKNITWGVVFVLAGVLVVLNGFGVVDFKLFFDGWWTLLIIVPCLNGLLFDRDKLGNLTGLLLGVLLLLWRQNILPSKAIGLSIGGAILVCFGIRMIWGSIRKKKSGLKFKFNKKSKKAKADARFLRDVIWISTERCLTVPIWWLYLAVWNVTFAMPLSKKIA